MCVCLEIRLISMNIDSNCPSKNQCMRYKIILVKFYVSIHGVHDFLLIIESISKTYQFCWLMRWRERIIDQWLDLIDRRVFIRWKQWFRNLHRISVAEFISKRRIRLKHWKKKNKRNVLEKQNVFSQIIRRRNNCIEETE